MHNRSSIQDILKKSLSTIHQKRVTSAIEMVSSLLNGGSLTVSSSERHVVCTY